MVDCLCPLLLVLLYPGSAALQGRRVCLPGWSSTFLQALKAEGVSFPEETETKTLDKLLSNHKQDKISRGGGWMGRDQFSLTGASGRASFLRAEKVAGIK